MSDFLGVAIFIFGLLLSIGLHELGHMWTAKKFGARVSAYMIGFGPTLWSKIKGDTQYGLKAIPLGGYVRIIGMFGPRNKPLPEKIERAARDSDLDEEAEEDEPFLRTLIENARAASLAEVAENPNTRAFYQLSVPKKITVMFGGPFMNLLLACVFLTAVQVGMGNPMATMEISKVTSCVPTEANPDGILSNDGTCGEGDFSLAHVIGIKVGDTLLKVNGTSIANWDDLGTALADLENTTTKITYKHGGSELTKQGVLSARVIPIYDNSGAPTGKTETVGFIGISPVIKMQGAPISSMPSYIGGQLKDTFAAILSFPKSIWSMGKSLFSSEPRPEDGPVSVIGISQISGQIASDGSSTTTDKLGSFLYLFGSLNLFLFAFNLVPILPLDGGHIAGAIYEGVRRQYAKLRGRPDPGPAYTARMMPLAYVMGLLLIGLAIVSILTDLIKPISF